MGHFFLRLKDFFFPIHRYELKKFVPLLGIHCFSIFNHYCLKNIKDSLIVTTAGVEGVSFLKLCVPIFTVLFMIVYTKASDRLKNERLYDATLGTFVGFFAIFVTVLYPFRESLHPSVETVTAYQVAYPSFFYLFSIWGVWSYAIFFVFAELWSTFIMTILFWQFMAQITTVQEAKRTYGFLLVFGQIAVAVAGWVGAFFSDIRKANPSCVDTWQFTLNCLIGVVIVTSFFAMYLYHWVYRNVLTDKRFYDRAELPGVQVKAKGKMRFRDSLRLVLQSHYLVWILVLVAAYGFTDNMLENFWKHELRTCFPHPNDYCTFMNHYTAAYGMLSIVFTLFVTVVFRRFSWSVGALLTPMILLIGGVGLFSCLLCKRYFLSQYGNLFSFSSFIAQFGLCVMVLDRSSKMSFFDMSKEISFIPLAEELKVKGKAVVDGMGYRFGKAFGSGFQVWMLTVLSSFTGVQSTYEDIAPYAFTIYLLFAIAWVFAVIRLNRHIRKEEDTIYVVKSM